MCSASQVKPRINFFCEKSIKCGCSNGEASSNSLLRSEINYSFFWTSLFRSFICKKVSFSLEEKKTCCLAAKEKCSRCICTFLWTKCCIKKVLFFWMNELLSIVILLSSFYYQHHHPLHSMCQVSLFYSSYRAYSNVHCTFKLHNHPPPHGWKDQTKMINLSWWCAHIQNGIVH